MLKQLTVDAASSAEVVINQATFYLALIISLGAAGGLIWNVMRGINNRVKKSKEEAEEKAEAEHTATRKYVDEKMHHVNEIKDRVEYIYRRMIDEYLKNNRDGKKDPEG